ncbi:MAG: hypothetical protein IPO30_04985 [Hyphomonadaceae bacterium]|nr:hypothetical protein [Hyphomonadaceae bacterium]
MRILKPAVTALAFAVLSMPALAQAPAGEAGAPQPAPKAANGKPDLTGFWTHASVTTLQRAPGRSLVVSEAEAKKIADNTGVAGFAANEEGFNKNTRYSDPNAGAPEKGGKDFGAKGYDTFWTQPGDRLAKVNGEYRTSYIIEPANGLLPFKDPAAQAKKRAINSARYMTGDAPYEGPEETAVPERCLIGFSNMGGPGMLNGLYNNNYQFVQTPTHLMILVEMVHDARIIPIFDNAETARAHHRPATMAPWLGDTVGWWEGDTFVMESVNVKPLQGETMSFPLSKKGVVTERLTRTSDHDVVYQFVVDDPETYTQTWKAELAFYPSDGLYEYACHEGNYGLPGILAGARQKEADAAAAKIKKVKAKN